MASLLPILLRLLAAGGGAAAQGGLNAARAAGPPLLNFARAHPRAAALGGLGAAAGIQEAAPRVGQGFSQLGTNVNNTIEQIPIIGDDLAGGFDRLGGLMGSPYQLTRSAYQGGSSARQQNMNNPINVGDALEQSLYSRGIDPQLLRNTYQGRTLFRNLPQLQTRALMTADAELGNFGDIFNSLVGQALGGGGAYFNTRQGNEAYQDLLRIANQAGPGGSAMMGDNRAMFARQLLSDPETNRGLMQALMFGGFGPEGMTAAGSYLAGLESYVNHLERNADLVGSRMPTPGTYLGFLDLLQRLRGSGGVPNLFGNQQFNPAPR